MQKITHPPAVFLMGPTASGKSALAVALAHRLNGEIISVDSALVYRDMNIGTAKPGLPEREGIPHHLIDILDPAEAFSTGQFRTLALKLMSEIVQRGRIPILAGGTMLYFNALSGGLAQLPEADPLVRAKLDEDMQQFGKEALHRRLVSIDPVAAARIHPNDPQRIQRALEVYEISGKSLSALISEAQASVIPYRIVKLNIEPEHRETLHNLIAQRFKLMLAQGFVEEVEHLMQRGDLDVHLPAIRAVGYRQIWAYLKGEYGRETMMEKGIAATRQLAKRQLTWLRRETGAFKLLTGQSQLVDRAVTCVNNALAE